ncbi:hypothetical protein Bbelb_145830 [Branchiostoma belcheri]|nr:hypothetical protein Bbelb_145830 [Branchiostoma belcheri]
MPQKASPPICDILKNNADDQDKGGSLDNRAPPNLDIWACACRYTHTPPHSHVNNPGLFPSNGTGRDLNVTDNHLRTVRFVAILKHLVLHKQTIVHVCRWFSLRAHGRDSAVQAGHIPPMPVRSCRPYQSKVESLRMFAGLECQHVMGFSADD